MASAGATSLMLRSLLQAGSPRVRTAAAAAVKCESWPTRRGPSGHSFRPRVRDAGLKNTPSIFSGQSARGRPILSTLLGHFAFDVLAVAFCSQMVRFQADGVQEKQRSMFQVAISQLTTSRWEFPEEMTRLAHHGFDCLSLWRPKLSDVGTATAAALLAKAGVRVSSLQWAGGFTGGDGRCHRDCVADAVEAIEDAAVLSAACVVIHSGCRGGHTRAHARRLLLGALETLAPIAASAGVTLALRPLHAAAADRCSFLTTLAEALEIVEQFDDPAVRLAVDLWQFGDDPDLPRLLPRLAPATALVQVADRSGPPTAELERRPAGRGSLPLEPLVLGLIEHGYGGDFEFDPVGEEVASLGYDAVLAETRGTADALGRALEARMRWYQTVTATPQAAALRPGGAAEQPLAAGRGRAGQFRSAWSRRSHASSQTVSRG